jgi:hypothetical protein
MLDINRAGLGDLLNPLPVSLSHTRERVNWMKGAKVISYWGEII